MRRVLYFDIDGVLVDYEDRPKVALADGSLEQELRRLAFDSLVCVSGWSDIAHASGIRLLPEQRGPWLHRIVAMIFPDRDWFLSRLTLTVDTDNRGRQIDLSSDWYYVDDWADQYFCAAWGHDLYERELGRRICLADPHADGGDILQWLRGLPPRPV